MLHVLILVLSCYPVLRWCRLAELRGSDRVGHGGRSEGDSPQHHLGPLHPTHLAPQRLPACLLPGGEGSCCARRVRVPPALVVRFPHTNNHPIGIPAWIGDDGDDGHGHGHEGRPWKPYFPVLSKRGRCTHHVGGMYVGQIAQLC
ncbi:hypothetical protein B0H67DRAFT_58779 [Lasiosphaeris hirsuta]|uniref:Secreted protein n=1 Tax=Lasiosphaeris hirsuta TaxID=260670 RepID=A0AA40EAG6_9PEZI|nr:hypothetical protein B0H67DRAFT_58779 [Lasiosphaeris hirsuta]